ncbi:hypothetical protein [Acidianus manzaensis]|uniref:hypothetical protein n=1 Tax=Acidianus manzaensis TaxID=282676 RepID=UPI001F2CAFA8|nr:hypothetical protein [Acidianus manzaensis]
MISISISLDNVDNNIIPLLSKSILMEKIDKNYVTIEYPLKIKINAESISRGRAIMNSYIFWIYTILRTLEEVEK